MGHTWVKVAMGLIGVGMAVAFLAVPAIKLKDPAMVVVMLIGVAAMIYNFIEFVREKDEP
ncbi:MAG: hypothetical protein ABI920_15445 [Casimicrobiaceae bacterium]